MAIAATIITWLLPVELKTTSAAPEAISVWDTFSPWFFFLRDTLDTDMANKYTVISVGEEGLVIALYK
jgi:hypothetical protein